MPYTASQGEPVSGDHVFLDREITFLAFGPRDTGVELIIDKGSLGIVQHGHKPREVLVRFGEHKIRFPQEKAAADLTLNRRPGEPPE